MQIRYVIDRFEDQGWAVLEDPTGHSFPVPGDWLPAAAAEGDVLLITASREDSEASIRFELDPEEQAKRLENIAAIRDRLKKGPSGDLEL
ncbi:hypothetical protein BH23GEM8_BH23GEM8_18570 [soil metagenome]